jgi:hypothetical protein
VFVAVALVGIWLNTQIRWIENRRELLAAQHAVFVRAGQSLDEYKKRHPHRWKYILEAQLCNGTLMFSTGGPRPARPAWSLVRGVLWMMREKPQASVVLAFVEDDPKRWAALRDSQGVQQAVIEAQKLFPEAEIRWTAYYTGQDVFGPYGEFRLSHR